MWDSCGKNFPGQRHGLTDLPCTRVCSRSRGWNILTRRKTVRSFGRSVVRSVGRSVGWRSQSCDGAVSRTFVHGQGILYLSTYLSYKFKLFLLPILLTYRLRPGLWLIAICACSVHMASSFVRSFVLSFVCWGANLFVFIYQVSSFNGTENGLRSVSRGTQTQSTYLVVDKSKESVFGIWYYGKP